MPLPHSYDNNLFRGQLPLEPTQLDRLIDRMLAVQPAPPVFSSSVGCSRATGSKHHVYLAILGWFIRMHTTLVRKGAQFFMGETHAGPAWYLNRTTAALTVGSPLIDLDVLDSHSLFAAHPYRAVFCERGKPKKVIRQLRHSIEISGLGTHGHVDILEGPFELRLPEYLDKSRGWQCGVMFVDANGPIAHDLIRIFQDYERQLRYVDVAIWHQAYLRRRFVGLTEKSVAPGGGWHTHPKLYDYRPLRELLPDFGKDHWLIRRPFNTGNGTAWTMLIGSNMPNLREWRAGELYRLDSLDGQAIRAECDGVA